MSRSRVITGATYIPDPRSGRPAALASVYIGQENLDPQVLANRKTVYLIKQDGSTVTILPPSQPLTTSAGGVIEYLGSPVQVETDNSYSIKVLDNLGVQIFYFPSVSDTLSILAPYLQSANFYENDVSSVSNAYVVTPPSSPLPSALLPDQIISWRPSADNSTASTLSVMLAGGPSTPLPYRLPDGSSDTPAGYLRTVRDYYCRLSSDSTHFIDQDLGLFALNPSIQVWNTHVNYYTVPSFVTGSDGNVYLSKSQTGPLLGGSHDPVSDAGVHWTRVYLNVTPPTSYNGTSGHLFGLTLSNDGGTPNTILDIAAGSARDNSNALDLTITTSWTKKINAVWASGTGNGGFPSGLSGGVPVNSTFYSFWIIGKTDGTVDFGFDSLAAGQANNPTALLADATGYTLFRRIGYIYYGIGLITKFFQNGNNFIYDVPVNNANALPTNTTAQLVTTSAPPDVTCSALIQYSEASNTAATGFRETMVTATRQTDTAPSSTVFTFMWFDSGTTTASATDRISVLMDTSGQIRVRNSYGTGVAGTSNKIFIETIGWNDPRGQ